uniref:Uncharacterized protein n=1 Tax=Arundo donax TaxID=35708 RepID=A0A0A9ECH9_ARUDO
MTALFTFPLISWYTKSLKQLSPTSLSGGSDLAERKYRSR